MAPKESVVNARKADLVVINNELLRSWRCTECGSDEGLRLRLEAGPDGKCRQRLLCVNCDKEVKP